MSGTTSTSPAENGTADSRSLDFLLWEYNDTPCWPWVGPVRQAGCSNYWQGQNWHVQGPVDYSGLGTKQKSYIIVNNDFCCPTEYATMAGTTKCMYEFHHNMATSPEVELCSKFVFGVPYGEPTVLDSPCYNSITILDTTRISFPLLEKLSSFVRIG